MDEEELDPEYAEYLRELPEIIANMIPREEIQAMGFGCPDPKYLDDDWSSEPCPPTPDP